MMHRTHHAVIVLGGQLDLIGPERIGPTDVVIAADGGLLRARALGLDVDILVGDFDSLPTRDLEHAKLSKTKVIRYPQEKDCSDFELALEEADDTGADAVTVISAGGGRIDHELANVFALANPKRRHIFRRMIVGSATLTIVDDEDLTITGMPGEIVSLLPLGGAATKVCTGGLLYPLFGETLWPFDARGLSNEMISTTAVVTTKGGALAVVQTGEVAGPHLTNEPRSQFVCQTPLGEEGDPVGRR